MSGHSFSLIPQKVPPVDSKYRKIKTMIPVPESLAIFDLLGKLESRSMHGQLPVVWDRAENFQVFDPYGNSWIDFTSTIFLANSGHANPKIISALQKMLDQKLLHTYTFANESRIEFLKKLIEISPVQFEKAFLLSSGTEATECAIKLIRMHGQSIKPSKIGIISFQGGMHGRTMGAEMLKGDPKGIAWIGYMDPNIHHLPIPYPWTTKIKNRDDLSWKEHFCNDMEVLKKKGLDFSNIAGFMIESYIGWSAMFFPVEYIQGLADFAKKYNILVAFDEIQSGFGRTGKLFAYQHYGVEPDLLCLGKGLSGSLPLSAVIGRVSIMDLPDIGSMSSTHSANPLCCAAGLANIEAIEEGKLIKESERKGKLLHGCLTKLKNKYSDRISYIFGTGLIAGIIFKNPVTGEADALFPTKVCEKAMQKGVILVHTGRESIKMGPPLTIPDDALLEGLEVLEESIIEVAKDS
ncbi:MAG: aminotransferase class III [Candidatus Schekmanbacteria bacterium RIFCSPHIGHO2_02_FULL_38_11]|uniref:Aminotransferase class III n=1 Tax=Candidatus Schekmanbacteria bacterium RIFCSPLOWO2_12_FULL_38_15 TaxID=1817883 RepID=A0A1F7SKU3_9BACT|nr:MAG: aminotransferase class III [Candidatus Schekmanbacteria bacterium RIFCSPLOWO2_02_FULL_38_14]OGL51347.1 MAG: aminotransferase class III [Candidatus Schekmanbacteria bacterium RIFCSPHIGHO2_02_FULL_38_11]OGL54400.1 MAG: aminotransferase class III [Candidatus Schekmanbacteria bacterium RIFCSPLOWO2_12_FULL_38_15]